MADDPELPSESAVETVTEPAPAAEVGPATRYSEATWTEIETHWECGTMTAVEIIKKYGVSQGALTKHFARYKIVRGSKKHVLKREAEIKIMGAAAAAVDPKAVEYEQKRKGRILQTRETFINLSGALSASLIKVEKQIIEGATTHAAASNEFKGLRHALLAAERIMDARLRCLNADADVDESKMPTLIFRDLTEEEIQAKMSADDDLDELDIGPGTEALLDDLDEEIVEEGEPP